jgi:iron(III) transport system substrate-binding protein
MQEAGANIKTPISFTLGRRSLRFIRTKGSFCSTLPRESRAFPTALKTRGFTSACAHAFGHRAQSQDRFEKDAPKTWKELLTPKWKGKMVSAHPGYSGTIMTHVLALVNLYGWDYFRDLSKNSLHLVQSANDPAGVVASGERPVGVNGAEYFYYKTQKQGNPITIVYPKEGVPLVVSPVAIAKTAPHPNAAKLFTEFIFAKESQQLLADKEGLYTGHPEVTYPADKPKLKDLKLLAADPDELEKRNAEIKKRFIEYFGA